MECSQILVFVSVTGSEQSYGVSEVFLFFIHSTSKVLFLNPNACAFSESLCSEVPYIAKTIFTVCLANLKLLTL